jgi:hypothetical protein
VTASVGQRRVAGQASVDPNAWPALLARFGDIIPPYPGPTLVPMVRVPPPPKFNVDVHGGLSLVDRARQLAQAFRAVYEKRVRKTCWAFGRSRTLFDVQSSRYYFDLAECADALYAHDVAPAAWCAFSFDVWKTHVATGKQAKKPPPVTWVLSGARADERLNWFLAELPRYSGGQVWVGAAHHALIRDWNRMREALLANRGEMWLTLHVMQIVGRYFRGDAYKERVGLAKREAEETIKMLADRVADGACLW